MAECLKRKFQEIKQDIVTQVLEKINKHIHKDQAVKGRFDRMQAVACYLNGQQFMRDCILEYYRAQINLSDIQLIKVNPLVLHQTMEQLWREIDGIVTDNSCFKKIIVAFSVESGFDVMELLTLINYLVEVNASQEAEICMLFFIAGAPSRYNFLNADPGTLSMLNITHIIVPSPLYYLEKLMTAMLFDCDCEHLCANLYSEITELVEMFMRCTFNISVFMEQIQSVLFYQCAYPKQYCNNDQEDSTQTHRIKTILLCNAVQTITGLSIAPYNLTSLCRGNFPNTNMEQILLGLNKHGRNKATDFFQQGLDQKNSQKVLSLLHDMVLVFEQLSGNQYLRSGGLRSSKQISLQSLTVEQFNKMLKCLLNKYYKPIPKYGCQGVGVYSGSSGGVGFLYSSVILESSIRLQTRQCLIQQQGNENQKDFALVYQFLGQQVDKTRANDLKQEFVKAKMGKNKKQTVGKLGRVQQLYVSAMENKFVELLQGLNLLGYIKGRTDFENKGKLTTVVR